MASACHPKKDIEYTDVVVIGNGPSGISLSYMLSGHWPYYMGESNPNEYLHLRLMDGEGLSVVEQDLEYLSSGLEGRSSNPLALLFDSLAHPNADMGGESPSLLDWRFDAERAIPHVVLGKKAEGGAWQMMDGDMQTLSLGNWMQLADKPFWDWLQAFRMKKREEIEASGGEEVPLQHQNRAKLQEVRQYYEEYVCEKGLKKYFRNHCTVTSVERVLDVCHAIDEESGEQTPCSKNHQGKFKWEVRGFELTESKHLGLPETTKEFCYRAGNVVLATGSYDVPNVLRVPGEQQPFVLHSLNELERVVKSGELTPESDPLLIVGAGLSAGDAVLYAQMMDIPVIHLFRRQVDDPEIVLKKLPALVYPEYHRVHGMMKEEMPDNEKYRSYQQHQVVEFKDEGIVLIRGKDSCCDTVVQVSFALVLIGSHPDFSFMPQDGKDLGIVQGMHINCKHNPLDVDPYSYQSVHEPGLFGMGPLVGDNFVRFLQGGALGITSHLWRTQSGKL